MQPRGLVKQLIEAMDAQSDKAVWTALECAEVMGVERKGVAARLGAAVRNGWLYPIPGEGRAVDYSRQAPETEATEPEAFHFILHSDGDVDLFGLAELQNGGFRMTREQVRHLKQFITWLPA